MIFWIALVLMTIAAIAAVAIPFWRARATVPSEADHDVEVYKDQLKELDQDLERGTLGSEEAEAARAEVARRLLRASREAEGAPAAESRGGRIPALVASAIVIPALAIGLYIEVGSPAMPDMPLAARMEQAKGSNDIASLIRRMEGYLKENPGDGRAWSIIGPVYLRLGLGEKAVDAFGNAIRLLGPSAELEASLGEALVAKAEGQITAEAKAAFERAEKLDPKAVRPRFFLAVAMNQEGKHAESVAAWEALLKEADANQPWVPFARRQMADARRAAGMPPLAGEAPAAPMVSAGKAPGPTAEDVAAAQDMSSGDRQAMIENMVQGLAERLESNGGSVDEWLRLLNAYGVLGKKDDAAVAVAKARAAFKDDTAALDRIAAVAKKLGLPE